MPTGRACCPSGSVRLCSHASLLESSATRARRHCRHQVVRPPRPSKVLLLSHTLGLDVNSSPGRPPWALVGCTETLARSVRDVVRMHIPFYYEIVFYSTLLFVRVGLGLRPFIGNTCMVKFYYTEKRDSAGFIFNLQRTTGAVDFGPVSLLW